MNEHTILVEELSKTFTSRERAPGFIASMKQLFHAPKTEYRALDGVSFRIRRGERVAFVGPNGAGKSTTIKILSGILHPDSGHATVAGFTPWLARKRLAYRIGTVFGQRSQLWYHLPARETFDLLAYVYDQSPREHARRRDALVSAFDIGAHLDKPVRQLSLGQRMRCEIVASLLHDPDVLFLDEPTIGLDVTAKAMIREVLRERSEQDGKTLLFTSHDTGDMESVCERVIVIHRGRVLVDQSLASLRRDFIRKKLLTLHTVEATLTLDLPGTRVVASAPHRTELELDLDIAPVDRVVAAIVAKARLRDLTVADPPMDDVVRHIFASADRDANPRSDTDVEPSATSRSSLHASLRGAPP